MAKKKRRRGEVFDWRGSMADRREKPIYSVEEAADYLGIPRNTLYAWTLGRRKPHKPNEFYPSVLQHVDRRTHRLSFFDLVEAHILRAAVEKDVPLKNIKRGLEYLRAEYAQYPRPLLTWKFKTDGSKLLVEGMLGPPEKDSEAIVNATDSGQLEMTRIIEEYLELLGWDPDGSPNRIFPKRGQRIVSIASGIVSGRPVIEGTRIPTAVVAQRFRSGESLSDLSIDYRLPVEAIEAAVKYEKAA